MRLILYARVSKALQQNPENQLIELRRYAEIGKHEVIAVLVDEISSKDTRPNKEEALKLLRLGQADGVAFVALDRWGRSMAELVLELEEFSKTGRALISLKEGLDLSTAAGRLMGNVLAAMANFERDRIRERTLSGLARARAQGKVLGRPRKTPPCKPGGFSIGKGAAMINGRLICKEKCQICPFSKKLSLKLLFSLYKIRPWFLLKFGGHFMAWGLSCKNRALGSGVV